MEAADLLVPPQWPVDLPEGFECVVGPRQRLPPSLVESSKEILIREAKRRDERRGEQKLCQA